MILNVFIRGGGEEGGEMEKRIRDKTTGVHLVAPGLSTKPGETKGQISNQELPRYKDSEHKMLSGAHTPALILSYGVETLTRP